MKEVGHNRRKKVRGDRVEGRLLGGGKRPGRVTHFT